MSPEFFEHSCVKLQRCLRVCDPFKLVKFKLLYKHNRGAKCNTHFCFVAQIRLGLYDGKRRCSKFVIGEMQQWLSKLLKLYFQVQMELSILVEVNAIKRQVALSVFCRKY